MNGDHSQISSENTEKTSPWKDLSFGEKLAYIRERITVEPVMVCHLMPSVLASIAVQNLNLEKACRVNKNYSDEICTNLIEQRNVNKTDEEVEVQILVAYMTAWRLPLQTVLPAIMILFIGAWSDKTHRRKPCMIGPMLGECMTAIGLIFCTYYFLEWPLEAAGVIEGLPPALMGGTATMLMAIFSYLADRTSPEERTFRIGIVNVIISIAVPVGTALSGILLNKLGFYGVFSICIGIYCIGFVYIFLWIEDKKIETDNSKNENFCKEYLSWRYVYDTFMVLFKKRKLTRRLRILLLMLSYILIAGPVYGTSQLIYLYARRQYNFNEVDFSIFSSYSIVMNLVGVIVGITLLSKILKIDDSIIAILACISKVLGSFMYAFAPDKTWFYFGPAIEIIGGTAIIAIRSIATKVVEPDEMGKILAIFGVCDALINSIYSPIFAKFYAVTIAEFPGAFCVLAGLLTIPSIVIFIFMYILQKREKETEGKDTDVKGIDNTACEIEVTSL